jgi:hypothetical protein
LFKKVTAAIWGQILLLLFLVPVSYMNASSLNAERSESLLRQIQKGGYILYIRHGETTGQDSPNPDFKNCSTQKNLNELGKKHAQALGAAFSKLKIPMDEPIWTSPYCRTRETAQLAFGERKIETKENLAYIYYLSANDLTNEQMNIKTSLLSMFETNPQPGSNQVIVGHSYPFHDSIQGEIPNTGTVVLKPKGPGNGFEFVGLIPLEDWVRWSGA